MSSITGSSSRLITKFTIGATSLSTRPSMPWLLWVATNLVNSSDIFNRTYLVDGTGADWTGASGTSAPKLRIAISCGGSTKGWLPNAYSRRFRSNCPSTDLDFSSALQLAANGTPALITRAFEAVQRQLQMESGECRPCVSAPFAGPSTPLPGLSWGLLPRASSQATAIRPWGHQHD